MVTHIDGDPEDDCLQDLTLPLTWMEVTKWAQQMCKVNYGEKLLKIGHQFKSPCTGLYGKQ
jgi:hypothetical protein